MPSSRWAIDVVKLAKSLFTVLGELIFTHPIVTFGYGLALITLGASLDNAILSFGGWSLFVLIPFYYSIAVGHMRWHRDHRIRRLQEEPWDAEMHIPSLIRSIVVIARFQALITVITIVLTLIAVWLEYGVAIMALACAVFFIVVSCSWASVRNFSRYRD